MANQYRYETLYTTEIDRNTGCFREKRCLFKTGKGQFPCNSERSYALSKEVLIALDAARAAVEADSNNHAFMNGTSEGFHGFRWRDIDGILHEIGVWTVWHFDK